MTSDFSGFYERVRATPLVLHPSDHAELVAASRGLTRQFKQVGRHLAEQFRPVVEQLARLSAQLGQPPGPPSDPRERALWLRRNRNTGPGARLRAPRRLDPAGGLRCDPRGRPTYRPAR